MDRRHCPETSRDANWVTRYYRIKVLPNVAENQSLSHAVPKLNEWGDEVVNGLSMRLSLPAGKTFLLVGRSMPRRGRGI